MNIEIFCRVVDNFGDAGVCGRLALQLASELGHTVRLWVDKPDVLAKLRIASHEKLTITPWVEPFAVPPDFADVVIETFACGTPPEVIEAMLAMKQPIWINLEYLSAEAWVEASHALPSTNPDNGLLQTFFFPGFSGRTGGLLLERGLIKARHSFDAKKWWAKNIGAPVADGTLRISLFGYPSAPIGPLLGSLFQHNRPVCVLLPEGVLPDIAVGKQGPLEIRRFPFLPQAEYDRMLWSCDLNFVRGEDSWIRAQWAGKPFIWQAYPQQDAAHTPKIEAFLALYSANLPPICAETLALAHGVWNLSQPDTGRVWPELLANLPALTRHAETWAQGLAKQPDLASQLVRWIEQQRIES